MKAQVRSGDEVIQGPVLQLTVDTLNFALCQFILEVTNELNELYPHETLYSLIMSLQMYFHSHGMYHKFLSDRDFADIRNILDNRMKVLSK